MSLKVGLLHAFRYLPKEIIMQIASHLDIDGRRLLGVYGKVTQIVVTIPKVHFSEEVGMTVFFDYYHSKAVVKLGNIELGKYFGKEGFAMNIRKESFMAIVWVNINIS
jgi:hypothetical protein